MAGEVVIGKGVIPIRADTQDVEKGMRRVKAGAANLMPAFAGFGAGAARAMAPLRTALSGVAKEVGRVSGNLDALTASMKRTRNVLLPGANRLGGAAAGARGAGGRGAAGGGGFAREASQAVARVFGRGSLGASSGISGAVGEVGGAFSNATTAATTSIRGIGEAFRALTSGGIKGVGDALAGIVDTAGQAASAAASAVGDLASAGSKAIGGVVAGAASLIPKVGEIVATAVTATAGLFSMLAQTAARAFAGIVSVAASAVSTAVRLVSGIVQAAASALGSLLRAVADALVKIGGTALASGAAIGFTIYKAVQAASDLNETIQKVGVVFGPATRTVTRGADEMARSLGVPRREFLDAVAAIGLIAKASKMGVKPAADLSLRLAKLGADAASFYNVPIEEALGAMRSGLVGESEPLRRFGVLLSEDAVKLEAMRLGIARNANALTEAQKVQARASLIIKGMTDASGDLARTQDSLANRTRELGGRWTALMETLGTAFLPAAQAIAGGLSRAIGDVTEWVEANKALFAGLAGFLERIGNAIGNVIRKWPTFLELAKSAFADLVANVKATFAAVSEAVAGVLPAVTATLGELGTLVMAKVNDLGKTLSARMEEVGKGVGQSLLDGIASAVSGGAASLWERVSSHLDPTGLGGRQRHDEKNRANLAAARERAQFRRAQEQEEKWKASLRPPPDAIQANHFDARQAGRPAGILGALGVGLGGIGQAVQGGAARAMASLGAIGTGFGASARTRSLLGQVTTGPAPPGMLGAGPAGTARERLDRQNVDRGLPMFGGTEAQAARILRTRARGGGPGPGPGPGMGAHDILNGLNDMAMLPAFTGGRADAERILRARGGRARGRGGPQMPEMVPGFKSEFVGLEDFARKIQMGIGGGAKDYAKDTADNTKSATDLLMDFKQNGITIKGGIGGAAVAV